MLHLCHASNRSNLITWYHSFGNVCSDDQITKLTKAKILKI